MLRDRFRYDQSSLLPRERVTAMRVLGLMMVHNAGSGLQDALDAMAEFCDGACVVVDRSTDDSEMIVRRHRLVRACRVIPPQLSDAPWAIGEGRLLNMLYRMAEHEGADWVLRLDCDERVEPGERLRPMLSSMPQTIAGVRFPKESTWDDPDYPALVPLMSRACSMQGAVWRLYPDIRATQPLHNLRLPACVPRHGSVLDTYDIVCLHAGWSTLAQRLDRVRLYTLLDPTARWNHGVRYDHGLLFGYGLEQLDELIDEYRRRRTAASIKIL